MAMSLSLSSVPFWPLRESLLAIDRYILLLPRQNSSCPLSSLSPLHMLSSDLPLRYSCIQIQVCKLAFGKDKSCLCVMHRACAAAHRSKENDAQDGRKQCIQQKRGDQTKTTQKLMKDFWSNLMKMTENEHNALPWHHQC